jgi:hypothetical protein
MQNRSGAKKRLFSRECAVLFDTKAATPHKSDGGGAPSLPWGLEGAVAPRCGSTFRKAMVGPPRRRGPKIQARMRRFFTGAASPRKSDGGGAPSLPWVTRALSRRGAEHHSKNKR